jgi:hypothetical protein
MKLEIRTWHHDAINPQSLHSICAAHDQEGTYLQQGVTSDDSEETFEALAAAFDDLVREAVGEDLAGEWWDIYPRRLSLKDIPKGLKVRIPATDEGVTELEGRDVCLATVEAVWRVRGYHWGGIPVESKLTLVTIS